MKFRYKVLFTNLILLSLGLGLVGYLMIHKNFELAKQTQLKKCYCAEQSGTVLGGV